MKIIITESQSQILWLRRRLGDPEINGLLKDIVIEGFDYTDPCEYNSYSGYETNIVNDSTITFINSYEELFFDEVYEESFDTAPLEEFIRKVILSKHRDRIQRQYRDRYCVDDYDDED